MHVESLALYPVKATAGLPVEESIVERSGLEHDRRWAVIGNAGKRLNATTHDDLLRVTAVPRADGGIELGATGRVPLEIAPPVGGPTIDVRISRLQRAVDAGEAASEWLSDHLGEHVRLAWLDNPTCRSVAPEHGGRPGDPLSLADAGPLLLTTTASLGRLNEWIAESDLPTPLAMARFRPNVVVDGVTEPFAEDDWRRIRIGDVDFRFAECCDRCVVTTIDPQTQVHGKEPIRTLAKHRKWDGKTWFGVRVVPVTTGRIRVGDLVGTR